MKHHVAIMKKSWGFLPKIASGSKVIESRWYNRKVEAWGKVSAGDTIYFKNSGEPVTLSAEVNYVLQFANLTPDKVKELLNTYGAQDGIDDKDLSDYYSILKDKKYCILIFLKSVGKVRPFNVSKTGFGALCAWLTADDVDLIKLE